MYLHKKKVLTFGNDPDYVKIFKRRPDKIMKCLLFVVGAFFGI